MDFEKFVSPISSYLDFLISFWTGDYTTVHQLGSGNMIEPKAVLLCAVAIGVYLIIRYTGMRIIPADPNPDSGPGPKIDSNSMLLSLVASLATPVAFEISFFLLSSRETMVLGSPYSTFNAGFMSAAALYPISAITSRVQSFSVAMQKVGGRPAKFALGIHAFVAIFSLWPIVLCFKPFIIVHDLTPMEFIKPLVTTFVLMAIILAPLSYFLWHWNKYVYFHQKQDRDEMQNF